MSGHWSSFNLAAGRSGTRLVGRMLAAPPALRIQRPVPRRFPPRKPMTIAVGLICDSGIVVASDTEESIPGLMKRDEGKITAILSRHGHTDHIPGTVRETVLRFDEDGHHGNSPPDTDIAVVGAGSAGYIDALTPRIIQVFEDHQWATEDEDLRSRIEGVIRRFYREHVIPFAAYPPNERPEVEMLIAYQRAGRKRVLVSEKTAVRIVERGDVAAVGAGAFFAKALLQPFKLGKHLDLRTAQLLAAYAIFRVKDFIDGCGKYTSMLTVPYAESPTRLQIAAIEDVFRELAKAEARALEAVFRHPRTRGDDPAETIRTYESLRDRCDVLLTPISQLAESVEQSTPKAPKRGRKARKPSRA